MGSVRTEPIDKWVRGYVGATAVVDSKTPLLFWEETFPVPGYAFAIDDVRMDLLHPASDGPLMRRSSSTEGSCLAAGTALLFTSVIAAAPNEPPLDATIAEAASSA